MMFYNLKKFKTYNGILKISTLIYFEVKNILQNYAYLAHFSN